MMGVAAACVTFTGDWRTWTAQLGLTQRIYAFLKEFANEGLGVDQEHVTFRWKDYAHGGKQGRMTLGATEFLRRFFLHVLPRGFVRIRHFGFLANRFRASRLALSRQLYSNSTVCLPHGNTLPHSGPRTPRLAPAMRSTITTSAFPLATALPVVDSAT